jgi:hypothetical protein
MSRIGFTAAIVAAGLLAQPSFVSRASADPPTATQIRISQNNLKQIALGIINYADANKGMMPNNIYDQNGKPLLSWRVQILPYLEQANLYQQFKLDEPWDSEHNKKLSETIVKVYAPIRGKAKAGETYYQGFVGEKAVFGPKNKMCFPASFADGTSNTALVFEAGEPITWTKPDELIFDEKKALPKLGEMFDGEFNVALADGSVLRCKKDPDEGELRKLIMPADGQPIDMKKLRK